MLLCVVPIPSYAVYVCFLQGHFLSQVKSQLREADSLQARLSMEVVSLREEARKHRVSSIYACDVLLVGFFCTYLVALELDLIPSVCLSGMFLHLWRTPERYAGFGWTAVAGETAPSATAGL